MPQPIQPSLAQVDRPGQPHSRQQAQGRSRCGHAPRANTVRSTVRARIAMCSPARRTRWGCSFESLASRAPRRRPPLADIAYNINFLIYHERRATKLRPAKALRGPRQPEMPPSDRRGTHHASRHAALGVARHAGERDRTLIRIKSCKREAYSGPVPPSEARDDHPRRRRIFQLARAGVASDDERRCRSRFARLPPGVGSAVPAAWDVFDAACDPADLDDHSTG